MLVPVPPGPPFIVSPPENITVNISQDALLTCRAEAYPGNLTYTWYKTKSPCPTFIPFTPQEHCQIGIIVIPTFQMRKLRLGGQRRPEQGHRAASLPVLAMKIRQEFLKRTGRGRAFFPPEGTSPHISEWEEASLESSASVMLQA